MIRRQVEAPTYLRSRIAELYYVMLYIISLSLSLHLSLCIYIYIYITRILCTIQFITNKR